MKGWPWISAQYQEEVVTLTKLWINTHIPFFMNNLSHGTTAPFSTDGRTECVDLVTGSVTGGTGAVHLAPNRALVACFP